MSSHHPARALALVVAVAALLAATPATAQDRADIDRTQIIGNRELPKVLYIVPWKKPRPGELAGKPPGSVLDEALAPVDRDVFRRELSYDAQTRLAPGTASATAPVTASMTAPSLNPASPLAR